jgi:hypothetical protein
LLKAKQAQLKAKQAHTRNSSQAGRPALPDSLPTGTLFERRNSAMIVAEFSTGRIEDKSVSEI